VTADIAIAAIAWWQLSNTFDEGKSKGQHRNPETQTFRPEDAQFVADFGKDFTKETYPIPVTIPGLDEVALGDELWDIYGDKAKDYAKKAFDKAKEKNPFAKPDCPPPYKGLHRSTR